MSYKKKLKRFQLHSTNITRIFHKNDLLSPIQTEYILNKKDYIKILTLQYLEKFYIMRLNQNFNLLAKNFFTMGTTLVFMPTVDKYDLYYPYISTNPYQKNYFFDIIREMKKNYILIDTKQISQKTVKRWHAQYLLF